MADPDVGEVDVGYAAAHARNGYGEGGSDAREVVIGYALRHVGGRTDHLADRRAGSCVGWGGGGLGGVGGGGGGGCGVGHLGGGKGGGDLGGFWGVWGISTRGRIGGAPG